MAWYRDILIKQGEKVLFSALISLLITSIFSLWYLTSGKSFEWQEIDPLSIPLSLRFFSALVFIGPGAYLYYFTNFYRNLYHFFRHILQAPELHRAVKKIFWILMTACVFVFIYIVVATINAILSFIYNIFFLIVFLSPLIGVFIAMLVISFFLLKKYLPQQSL